MTRNPKQPSRGKPAQTWQDFIAREQKTNSKLGKLFATATYGGYENRILTLYFADDKTRKTAQGQSEALKQKLKTRLLCDRIDFRTGRGHQSHPSPRITTANPLQALNLTELGVEEPPPPILHAAVDADSRCREIYHKLNQRTQQLVGEMGETFTVSFDWRLRVGGTRGFRELLFPTFHPVFGIPYIPASSLKGVAKTWANQHHPHPEEVQNILGMLEGNTAKAAKIEILDAFPTQPCLSVDVATPQWQWQNQNQEVIYRPEPHPLLNLEQPQLLIGLLARESGYRDKISLVKQWLEGALKTQGLGSRVSGGYGRILGATPAFPHHQHVEFQVWTEGMYGSTPPTKENHYRGNPEFRPPAIRGILRYWFRAVALGLYDKATALRLEEEVFGKLGQQGNFRLSTRTNPSYCQDPYLYTGKITIEAKTLNYFRVVERSLILASLLGGVGRGSRRPLHRLNGRMRGCHWLVEGEEFPLAGEKRQWQEFFQTVHAAFHALQPSHQDYISSPGTPQQRQQDVLDQNAQVWLIQTPDLIAPERVKDWQSQGDTPQVRGTALSLLYSNSEFKGISGGTGNAQVGGKLGTPSFVWIKSIFPPGGCAYQVVTIFGANHPSRGKLARELQELGASLVYGSPSAGSSRPRPRRR